VPSGVGNVELNVNTVTRRIGVEALGTARDRVTCRRGYVPVGWGFDIRPPSGDQNVLPPEETRVFQALAGPRSYAFGLENLGAGGHSGLMRVRCLQRTVRGGGRTHSWRVRRVRHSNRVRAGRRRTVEHSCPRGHLSLGPGHSLDPAGDMNFLRSFDTRVGSARWLFDNTGDTERATTQLVCLSTGSSFR
jgi:hypothetical protein